MGYDLPVTDVSVAGFDSPNHPRRTAADLHESGGFFMSAAWLCSCWAGRAGGLGLPVSLDDRSVNPHGSAHFAFDSAWVENLHFSIQGVQS